jgi:chromosome segregation ATPase
LFIVLGLALGSGALYIKLRIERSTYEQEISELKSRFDLLKDKYSEEKARANGLLRTRSTLEGQMRAIRTDMEALQEEKEKAAEERDALRAMLEKKAAGCKQEIKALSERYDGLLKKHKDLIARHEETKREYDEKVNTLLSEKEELDMTLKETTYNLERCERHNTELAEVAAELVVKYRDKGVVDSMAQKEPFTGLKQVKMEKLIQEYQDKIDDHQLEQ